MRAPGQHGKARTLVFSRLHHVFDEGAQIIEGFSEGLYRKIIGSPVGEGFLFGRIRRHVRMDLPGRKPEDSGKATTSTLLAAERKRSGSALSLPGLR